MPKRITAADATDRPGAVPEVRITILTLDNHVASVVDRVGRDLAREIPGLRLTLHAAAEWDSNPDALAAARADIATAHIIVCTMIFLDDQIRTILPDLKARQDDADALVCCMSAGEIVRLTRIGRFHMDAPSGPAMTLLKKLRGSAKPGQNSGAKQVAMLKRLPQILRFIPGKAQDVRAYFLTLQYWLAGSEENVANMIRLLISRYASGPRAVLRDSVKADPPVHYPDTGLYHPAIPERVAETLDRLPGAANDNQGTVGLLVMRSYALADNTEHYDGVIRALEARGLRVVPAFASGLDARPAIEAFFMEDGRATVDAVVSLTGFSLVGGPAYNDSRAAEDMLARLDVPYVAAHAIEFQSLESWGGSDRGLMPVEATIMVAIPELDGATGPVVFGGRADANGRTCDGCDRHCRFKSGEGARDMRLCAERADVLASRVGKLIALRKARKAERKIALVLFNFPPNAGNTGTAAYLSVFASLHRLLDAMRDDGYDVEVPDTVDALREAIIGGNAERHGAHANVAAVIPADDHVRRERYLDDIEAQWGPAPGRQQSDGRNIFVLGAQFGNVFVGVQPAFGYEGDPMRLLFEKGFAPTHAFSAFYRWLREDFGAHAALHFGTHGALEFMPGHQVGMAGKDWPDRLIGDLPNLYLYASNNPSEGTIAKRRAAATLISYLTPPIAHAGLYKGLTELKASIERWRGLGPGDDGERPALAGLIQTQAASLDLAPLDPVWDGTETRLIDGLWERVLELEYTLIPHGLHTIGEAMTETERADLLAVIADAQDDVAPPRETLDALARGDAVDDVLAEAGLSDCAESRALFDRLASINAQLVEDHEIPAVLHALDGGFMRPAPGGDLIRTPEILPTGRNLHGFDPFKIPSAFALADGAKQAARLLDRHLEDGNGLPASIALVLWGTDNLKTEGGPIGQALALMGAKPRFDSYGRLAGAELIALDELKRPRIDVVMTLSGIFRDLLPLQTKLLAEAAWLAASADEPAEQNFVRKHTLAYMAEQGCDFETAALRVFSNADGTYGSNVNNLIESGAWNDEDEIAETYTRRKSFAYGRSGDPVAQPELLGAMLADVELTFQNLDSVELGVTTIDHYFDTLGGISKAVARARGQDTPVYIGDQTRGDGKVRTLGEQVALETRTRALNPKWYEGMLKHGYEGVRQIEEHITNTMGWSATTGHVDPWVYQQLSETYVLDAEMRERLAALNPTASAKLANRLIEAYERQFWTPDQDTLDRLMDANDDLEDRLEGILPDAAGQSALKMEAAE